MLNDAAVDPDQKGRPYQSLGSQKTRGVAPSWWVSAGTSQSVDPQFRAVHPTRTATQVKRIFGTAGPARGGFCCRYKENTLAPLWYALAPVISSVTFVDKMRKSADRDGGARLGRRRT
jgi:hypothetical protein